MNQTTWGNQSRQWHGTQIWAAIISPLFQIMMANGFLATLECVMSCTFVDNMDLCILGAGQATAEVASTMQKSVTNWEGLMQAMGGLVPDKCFWYLINQTWL